MERSWATRAFSSCSASDCSAGLAASAAFSISMMASPSAGSS